MLLALSACFPVSIVHWFFWFNLLSWNIWPACSRCAMLSPSAAKLNIYFLKYTQTSLSSVSKVHDLSWFLSCRIWDKVVCGSSKILVFVAVGLLMVYRHPLLMEKSAQGVNMFFSKVCCFFVCLLYHANTDQICKRVFLKTGRSRTTNEALIRLKLQGIRCYHKFSGFFGQPQASRPMG